MKKSIISVILAVIFVLTGCNNQAEICGGGTASHTEHHYEKQYWPSAPTCQEGGYYNLICSLCGADGGSGDDPALPHTMIDREETHGDCMHTTVVVTECSVCGAELGREGHYEPHVWVSGETKVFNEVTLEWDEVPITYCSVCGAQQSCDPD